MQIVINIPEELYKANHRGLEAEELWDLRIAIKNGTPLPKGHGRLIDADETLKAMDSWDKFGCSCHDMFRLTKNSEKDYISYVYYADMVKTVSTAPTIIEADKAESEDKG